MSEKHDTTKEENQFSEVTLFSFRIIVNLMIASMYLYVISNSPI